MQTIDLERLVVRQSYLIPIKEDQISKAVLQELDKCGFPYSSIHLWFIKEEHEHCFTFSENVLWRYLDYKGISRTDIKACKSIVKEFEENSRKLTDLVLKWIFGNIPIQIHLMVKNSQDNNCEVELECIPYLYQQLHVFENTKVTDFDIQDAYLTCKRFLRDIFVGGLNATLISEKERILTKINTEFLLNDVNSRQITEKLDELLENATTEILVFGWIGTILLDKLRKIKTNGVEMKVITGNIKTIRQDPMRKEKELAINELINIIGKDHISIKADFHGRAIIIDNKALIGSMDLDSYSLTGTRIEFAMYTEDPEIVRCLRNYFNQIFTPWKEEDIETST